jgi:predicted amidohydrolase YtcJ
MHCQCYLRQLRDRHLALGTCNAALEGGKLADLVVLSQDIFEVSDEELPKTESVLTVVGGRIAYSREPIQ